ncbi:MAG: radical SAM protein [bacterium]|nr:radical SAM protein [bacterium]
MNSKKILLLLLPFWDPQIPPSGISCLKSFLRGHGYPVKTVDANIEDNLKEIYHRYFDTLKAHVPEDKLGNFYKIGFDILRNHMMAHLHRKDNQMNEYIELIKRLVHSVFFIPIGSESIYELDRLVAEFYDRLTVYILELLEAETPAVLGISVYSDTLPASLFAFKTAKEKYPGIQTVMGGGIFASDLAPGTPNMSFLLEKAPYIDKLLVGEGENLFLHYLEDRLPRSRKVITLGDIQNKILDIESTPNPDFSDFDLVHYPYLTAYSSRSCPYQCKFCAETKHWGKFRKKSARRVTEELLFLYREHGTQLFLMSDSLLNPVVTDLARCLAEAETSIYWDGYLRADGPAGDTENTLLWRRGGFYRARLGIESGSRRVLELMNKNTTVERMKAAISALAYAGIKTTTYWVVGFPGETEEDFQETLDFLTEMADDIFEADCSPFWYFLDAQGGNEQWRDKSVLLYPEEARDLLVMQTWTVDCEPQREEIYRRMWRFVEHCKKLEIPNPYSLLDFHQADLRWSDLHPNAVPPLVSFGKDKYIDENKNIKEFLSAQTTVADDGDFGF